MNAAADIDRLAAALDAALVDRRTVERFESSWLEPAMRWSSAVWAAAVALGPAELTDTMRAQGLALAARPVFVCGAHRSGTTLMHDLLDGHPALAVLPSEASWFGNFRERMARLPADEAASLLGQAWLRRLVNPNNQPPFWLLGRDSAGRYVAFARRLLAWLPNGPAPRPDAWPLAAVALACAGEANGVTRWVEKTPGTERHIDRIRADFPDAKVIHVVRAPQEVAASHKALIGRADDSATGMAPALWALIRSYRIAGHRARRESPARYHIVRYEDLIARRGPVMSEIADFLGIASHEALLHPTTAGLATATNSSFADGGDRRPPRFTLREHVLLAMAAACYRALPAMESPPG